MTTSALPIITIPRNSYSHSRSRGGGSKTTTTIMMMQRKKMKKSRRSSSTKMIHHSSLLYFTLLILSLTTILLSIIILLSWKIESSPPSNPGMNGFLDSPPSRRRALQAQKIVKNNPIFHYPVVEIHRRVNQNRGNNITDNASGSASKAAPVLRVHQKNDNTNNNNNNVNATTFGSPELLPPFYFDIIKYTNTNNQSKSTSTKNIIQDYLLYEEYRDILLTKMDKIEFEGSKRKYYHDVELEDDPPRNCYRPNWKSKFYPTCNTFQEQSMTMGLSNNLQYRGSGYFRDAWTLLQQEPQQRRIKEGNEEEEEIVVLKTLRQEHPISILEFVQMSKEAIIMEQLTPSPHIVNLYGYCGVSSMVENMPFEVEDEIHTQLEREEIKKYYIKKWRQNTTTTTHNFGWQPPLNNLTSIEKLTMAIEVAESLADIHGYEGGVIIHGDTHPCQWLRNSKQKLKLNDFNNAIIMDWSYDTQKYCRDHNKLPGTFRSPEEHLGQWKINERSEIYAMGGMLYTILTGVDPYWEYPRKERYEYIRTGSMLPPPIDNHYRWQSKHPIEFALTQIMDQCYIHNIEKRPNIFQILRLLRDVQKSNLTKQNK